MKDRIMEMLGRGESVELVFVDREGFTARSMANKCMAELDRIIVSKRQTETPLACEEYILNVSDDELEEVRLDRIHARIYPHELKYFKIREAAPTFNDLIDVAVQAVKIGTIVKCKFSGDIKRVIKIEGNIVFLDDDSWNYLVSDEVVMPDYVLYDDTVTGKKLTRDNLKPGANILHKFYGFKKRVSKVLADRNEVYYESGGWDYIFGDAGMLDKYYLIEDKKDEVEALIESRSSETYNQTFNDLIDVAVQAVKDGKIYFRFLSDGQISFSVGRGEDTTNILKGSDGAEEISSAINLIDSLYTETFVIEGEEDIKRFNRRVDSIVLANGEDIIEDIKFHRGAPYFLGGLAIPVPYSVLKGATVTQKRGDS